MDGLCGHSVGFVLRVCAQRVVVLDNRQTASAIAGNCLHLVLPSSAPKVPAWFFRVPTAQARLLS